MTYETQNFNHENHPIALPQRMKAVHVVTPHFCKVLFNIIFPHVAGSRSMFSFKFFD